MAYVIGYWHLLDPLESNIASKHVIKNILFQKECGVEQSIKIHLDSSQLLLVMQPKNYLWVYSLEQSVTISSVSGVFQTWWDLRVTWNSWFSFKWSNCSHWCWKDIIRKIFHSGQQDMYAFIEDIIKKTNCYWYVCFYLWTSFCFLKYATIFNNIWLQLVVI